jgi:hypothetical protein
VCHDNDRVFIFDSEYHKISKRRNLMHQIVAKLLFWGLSIMMRRLECHSRTESVADRIHGHFEDNILMTSEGLPKNFNSNTGRAHLYALTTFDHNFRT